jgi:hypothetical protein
MLSRIPASREATALTGMALGVAAGRLCLEGILTVAFNRKARR